MASSTGLHEGYRYEINSGDFKGEVVTMLDPKPVSDGLPNQRKVLVLTPEGQEYYILPRQLRARPVNDQPDASAWAQSAPPPGVTALQVAAALHASAQAADEAPIPVATVEQVDRILNPITDPMDPRLDHLRPSRRKLTQYISREVAPGLSDIDFLLAFTSDVYRVADNNDGRPASVLLKGDTQCGKTMLVEVLAIAWSERMAEQQRQRDETVTYTKPMPIFTISGSAGITDFDMFGETTSYTDPATGQATLVWLPGMVEMAATVGGILYIDEVYAIDPRYTASLHPLIDHRHSFINRHKAVWKHGQFMPDVTKADLDLWVIATGNEAYAGMGKPNEAFINRFESVCWGYDKDVEAKLIKSAAIRFLGDALRTARAKNSIRTPCGTAALQRCERNVKTFGPVTGLFTLTSMFAPQERPIVDSIIEDRSIIILLNEELRMAAQEAAARGE
jgi:MoxR-like ATPase